MANVFDSFIWPDGFAGISSNGFFSSPAWVNEKLRPGETDQTSMLSLETSVKEIVSLRYMFWSPNLVWLAISLAAYIVFPYNIDAARNGFALSWLMPRLWFNLALGFGYYMIFAFPLYFLEAGKRKYAAGSYPTIGNRLHNLWYWALGVLQWTLWEAVMIRIWASGLVDFATAEQLYSSPLLLGYNVVFVFLVPIWRDIHFYAAHRFVHIRALYKYVHSLHHRNPDPEPFSGLTMHPVEHLYYFSNVFTPSLFLPGLSPFIFLYTFYHLTLAPAGGHSGFEDAFHSDQYHYVHHRKFECNYGSPFSAFIDQYFGTFRESISGSKTYKGEWSSGKEDKNTNKKPWSANGYLGLPASPTHACYTTFWVALFPIMYWGAVANIKKGGLSVPLILGMVPTPSAVAFTVAYMPVLVAVALAWASNDRLSWRWPFHKERIFGAFGFFFFAGWICCVHPVYRAVELVCSAV